MLYERILVGFDGSPTASAAVTRAVQVARVTGASLTILHVGVDGEGARTLVESAAARYAGSGVEIDARVEAGDAAQVLIDVAQDQHYDLLVVGNKGMKGAARFFLGSVPNKISHHARCSLMIVRTT